MDAFKASAAPGDDPDPATNVSPGQIPSGHADYSKAAYGALGDVHIEHKPKMTINQTINHGVNHGGHKHAVMPWVLGAGAVVAVILMRPQATVIVQQAPSVAAAVAAPPAQPQQSLPSAALTPVVPDQALKSHESAGVAVAKSTPPAPAPVQTETAPRGVLSMLGGSSSSVDGASASLATDTSPSTMLAKVSQAALRAAKKDKPFINGLSMRFIPLGGAGHTAIICQHETRQKDYAAYVKDDFRRAGNLPGQPAASDAGAGREMLPLHPVVNVSLVDGQGFCKWLSAKEGIKYRLPTDHELSIAMGIGSREDASRRAAEKHNKLVGAFVWGSDKKVPPGTGNLADVFTRKASPAGFKEESLQHGIFESYTDGFATTAPVMQFEPNAQGLYDLVGNAWEWCVDQARPDGREQPLRGGSWLTGYLRDLGASTRLMADREAREPSYGFRCVIDLE